VFNSSTGGGASNAISFTIGPGPATTSAAAVSAANPQGGAVLGQRMRISRPPCRSRWAARP
jgi:hypothetical protein